ncbi:luciferase-like monooxygenase family protein [Mycobacterium kansasii]|uniref:Luciferase-like monooxygenase family protein n=1 Tax=Mycobacterium kansasii TaxID=1768 RepID=A0A1V3WCL3_MYCKA|nr:luciferase-like monooxygenase family protein [Mycobacterium kansasii]
MRTATTVELSSAGRDTVEFVVEAEKLGLDVCWVAEAWGTDGPSALGYLGARTERMLLGSGYCNSVSDRPLRWPRPRSRCPTCRAGGSCSAWAPRVRR